jgi:hypothetical protein
LIQLQCEDHRAVSYMTDTLLMLGQLVRVGMNNH